jgi:hypothetical protein
MRKFNYLILLGAILISLNIFIRLPLLTGYFLVPADGYKNGQWTGWMDKVYFDFSVVRYYEILQSDGRGNIFDVSFKYGMIITTIFFSSLTAIIYAFIYLIFLHFSILRFFCTSELGIARLTS